MKVIQDWLRYWSAHAPDNVALVDGDTQESWTYPQFFSRAQAGAFYLENKFSIKKGDRIAFVGQNDLSVLSLFFAASRLGAVLVPINYRLSSREVAYIFSNSQPSLVVHDNEFAQLCTEAALSSEIPQVSKIHLEEFAQASVQKNPYPKFHAEENDPAMIIYTSGTTGFPKGAMISHRGLFWNSVSTSLRLCITQYDCAVTFLPLFHTGGWNVLTSPFLHHGAKIVLTQKFDPDQILKLSQDHKATLLFGVPTTMGMMARTENFWNYDLSNIRYAIVGGEPMPIELIRVWHDKKIPIRQGYGLTEFGPNVFSLSEKDAISKIGSIGFPNSYIDVKVVGENDQPLGAHEVGELCLSGPACMLGYWQNSKATDDTIQDGWLRTGDLVRFDDDGYFYVVGRKKDMFKSGGENVYPAEIEQIISQVNWVQEVAVIGVPDEKWGEVGKAYIVCEKNIFNSQELHDHCAKNLAKFKIPKHFEWISQLPKSGAGKVLKRELGTSR